MSPMVLRDQPAGIRNNPQPRRWIAPMARRPARHTVVSTFRSKQRSAVVIRLARLSIRHPVASLITLGVLGLALSLIGLGVSRSTSPTITVVPGTEASRAQHLADSHFGPSVLVPILLEGPAKQLDRQGPVLVRDLTRRGDTRVLSAWDAGAAGAQLRPNRRAAMIVAAVAKSEKDMVKTEQARIEKLVARDTYGPVKASVTGQPSIDRAMPWKPRGSSGLNARASL